MYINSKLITRLGKQALVATGLVVGLVGVTNSAQAALIATDDFNYSIGEISGQNGGSGWGTAWTGIASLTEVVDPGTPLSYSTPGAGINGGDRALEITGNNDNVVSRGLSSAQSGNTVFVSFLVRTSGLFTANDFASFWFDNVATGGHTLVPNIGIKSDGGVGGLDFMARLSLGIEVYSTAATSGTNYLVVGRLSKSVPGAANNYDSFALWVNPSAGAANSPDATATLGVGLSSFTTVGVRTTTLDTGDSILFDYLSLSTTYSDAIGAVPEPGSMMLLASGGALLLFLRRRRAVRA